MKLIPILFALMVPALAAPPGKDAADPDPFNNSTDEPGSSPVAQISVHLDWIRLPHAEANHLVREHLPHARDAGALYAATQELIIQKKAERLDFTAIPVRNGQRSRTESITETPYPTEFDPSMAGIRINSAGEKYVGSLGNATPSSFTFRNVGATTEVQATLLEDGLTIDLNLAPESVEHLADIPWGRGLSELKQPVFGTMKLATQVFTESGAWQLAGLLTPPATAENRNQWGTAPFSTDRVLLFIRATKGRGPEAKPVPVQTPPGQSLVFAEWIETDTAIAASLLNKYPAFATSPAFREEMEPMLTDGRAALMHTAAVMVRMGKRSKMESIIEFPHPGENDRMHSAQAPGTQPFRSKSETEGLDPFSNTLPYSSETAWMPERFDFRNLGTLFEVEATICDGNIDLNVAPELLYNAGVESFGTGISQAEWAAFQRLASPSRITLAPNTPAMVASFDVPGKDGKDDSEGKSPPARTRKVFLFVRCFL